MQEIERCITTTALSKETIGELIAENNKRGYINICDTAWWRQGEKIAIVGGGPSLKDNIEKLKDYDWIMVCGSAHDYLWEQGIRATWCVVVDSDPIMATYLKHADGAITYLVASQCSKEVFEHLKEFDIYTWHADGDTIDNKEAFFGEGEKVVGGGCTVGTRAIILAIGMGFTNIHLYGFDSCLTNEYQHHAYQFNNPAVETLGDITDIKLGDPVNGPTFKVASYMLAQIFDFQNILKQYGRTVSFKSFGDGAITYILDLAYRNTTEVIKNGSP